MRDAIEGASNRGLAMVGAEQAQSRKRDITLRENIDRQIEQAEDRVRQLQDTKARLEASHLLDTRIEDLEVSMRW
jgi:hypothetical protein